MCNYAEIKVKQMCRNMKQYMRWNNRETSKNAKRKVKSKIQSPYLPMHLVSAFPQGGREGKN